MLRASCSWNACWKPKQPRFWSSFKDCVELIDRRSGPHLGGEGSRLFQRIRGLWRLCCAIVFGKCFCDDFSPAVLKRLFDDADYVLIAHPHGAARVILCAISTLYGFAVAFRRRSVGFPQSGEELAEGLRMVSFNVRARGRIEHVYLHKMATVERKRICPHRLLVAAAIGFQTCAARCLLFGELHLRAIILCVCFGGLSRILGQLTHAIPVPSLAHS